MNILFLLPYTPTPIRTRPYNFLRGILHRGHQVTLAALYETQEERDELMKWQSWGATVLSAKLSKPQKILNLLSAIPTSKPMQSVFCWQPELMRLVKDSWLKEANEGHEFDVIHVEHLRGAQFGLGLQRWLAESPVNKRKKEHIPILWDSVDCISLLFEKAARSSRSRFGRLATAFDLPRTRRYEGWLAQQFNHTLVTAEADRVALAALVDQSQSQQTNNPKIGFKSPITVLPNGVDLNTFFPNYGKRKDATIVMSGKMSYHANVTAALYLVEEVMPQVWDKQSDAVVQIVGANPSAEIRSLTSRYPGQVEVTGTVPDLVPYLQQATLAAAPIAYGVGIQNKVLEAMACATPIVCTPQAVSALKARPEQDLMVGETAPEFSKGILKLLDSKELQENIGAAGRKYVEDHHSWENMVQRLEEIYLEVSKTNG